MDICDFPLRVVTNDGGMLETVFAAVALDMKGIPTLTSPDVDVGEDKEIMHPRVEVARVTLNEGIRPARSEWQYSCQAWREDGANGSRWQPANRGA